MGSSSEAGILAGSASLTGGHGTTITWAPNIAALGVDNALEIGIGSATLGLIAASLIGDPIANAFVIRFAIAFVRDL